ncbi:hypothetical protein ACLKA7_007132 [Drosophila subpalustris]
MHLKRLAQAQHTHNASNMLLRDVSNMLLSESPLAALFQRKAKMRAGWLCPLKHRDHLTTHEHTPTVPFVFCQPNEQRQQPPLTVVADSK